MKMHKRLCFGFLLLLGIDLNYQLSLFNFIHTQGVAAIIAPTSAESYIKTYANYNSTSNQYQLAVSYTYGTTLYISSNSLSKLDSSQHRVTVCGVPTTFSGKFSSVLKKLEQ